ncbi:MAG: nucleoside triphosphate pyrophosphohydrolase [Acidimicrobiia bacterium]
MTPGHVVVVGLGPAGVDLMLPAARSKLSYMEHRYARTVRHPAIDELARHGLEFVAFDDRYETAASFDDLYAAISADLVQAAAEHGSICYAVPGNPGVAERSVLLLRDAAARDEITLEIVPGISFSHLAWSRLGVDPMDGARLVDGQSFAVDAAGLAGPLLIGHCINQMVLSDIKLVLLETLPPDAPVTVLQRLGLPDEQVVTVPLVALDRDVAPDHLTSVFVDVGHAAVAGEFAALVALSARLRAPGGCPWDAEQTHHSLARYLLEESYETVEAIERLPADAPAGEVDPDDYAKLEDELGDLLYQVVFHSVLAREAGAFTIADVSRGVHEKLVRRHPHIFGDVEADTVSQVMTNWEQIKKGEKGSDSIVEGISPGLASLLYVHKLYRKAASIGLEPGNDREALDRAALALDALRGADAARTEAALGDLLAAAVVLARARGVDAETSLRGWSARFRDRFVRMERLAAEQGVDLAAAPGDRVAALWIEAAT